MSDPCSIIDPIVNQKELAKSKLFTLDCNDFVQSHSEGLNLPTRNIPMLTTKYDITIHNHRKTENGCMKANTPGF